MKQTNDATDDSTHAGQRRTRRAFLGTTAAVGAVTLAGCSGSTDGGAGSTTDTTSSMGTTTADIETTTEREGEMANPDVPILNYALTLEHLENAFYRDGLKEFSDDELMGAKVLSKFGEGVRMDVPTYLKTVGDHEAAHVDALTKTVKKLGGTPVEEADYDFGYETPSEFLGVARALENTGVAAYAGAAPSVVNNDVLAAAAGIHSVEARHASFLNLLNGKVPFPNAVDKAKSMDEVLEIAGGFITSDVDTSAYEMGDSRPTQDRKKEDDTTDVNVLNYALTLEHLENAFYRDGLKEFGNDNLMNADALSDFDEHTRKKVPSFLQTVSDHEAAHVDALTKTVKKLGGTPVEEADYDFGYGNASEFLGVAKALENTGVAAYKGAAPTVENDDVFAAAIGIHSVEAEHASFLNELDMESPFPKAVDEPKTMSEVKKIAGQFIVSN
ncbi:ferritin-like domain-containing protein [Haladaptatus sp. CMAA 1911]|uniref:ferritin-like domain-containing protein n=1 Tax=unclassified Haladaptatus TaxID=2622732 RepID=UPI00375476CD